jgi:DNA-binding XRE family transcriptional regulator
MNDSPQKVSVLRRMLGIGQKSIAADLKVAQETISKWELGKIPIPKNRVDALACCLEPADFKNLPLAAKSARVVYLISADEKTLKSVACET